MWRKRASAEGCLSKELMLQFPVRQQSKAKRSAKTLELPSEALPSEPHGLQCVAKKSDGATASTVALSPRRCRASGNNGPVSTPENLVTQLHRCVVASPFSSVQACTRLRLCLARSHCGLVPVLEVCRARSSKKQLGSDHPALPCGSNRQPA